MTATSIALRPSTMPMPAEARIVARIGEGMTLDQIVAGALPAMRGAALDRIRVTLVTQSGVAAVDRRHWHRVRPHAGTAVVIRFIPQGDNLRSVLSLVLTIASIAIGNFLAPVIAGSSFGAGLSVATWKAIIGIGTVVLGSLVINTLIPPPDTGRSPKPLFAISGWRNETRPDGVMPDVLGRMRYAPPFATTPHIEIIDGKQYFCGIFCFGYGPVALSDHRIGDTSIDDFQNIEMQVRTGEDDDDPITLFSKQIVEEAVGTELVRPLERDDKGDIIDEDASGIITPVKRTLARDSVAASVILVFPAGLVHINDDGDEKSRDVAVRIRAREVGTTPWSYERALVISGATRDPFYRQHSFRLATRGDYEIEVTRLTSERTAKQTVDRVELVAIQSIRPEYGIAFPSPLALVAIRIKASYQLNGGLDSYNARVSRKALDYDHTDGTWSLGETRNPAALFRHVLQSSANARPAALSEIDLDALEDWHDFCRINGLHYDRVHDFEGGFLETLQAVAAAGRATPRHDGRKWSVVIDRPQTVVVDHINPRNSAKLEWQRSYFTPPHAFRVQFQDSSNNYEASERLVRWPGYSGDITITEQIELPGKVDPAEVWREARRRQNEMIYRPDVVTVTQDGAARVAVRGDLVMVNYDTLSRLQAAARVKSVTGPSVQLDDVVSMVDGETYAIRFRIFGDPDDSVGTSVVGEVVSMPGNTSILQLVSGPYPDVGTIVHFGPMASESAPMIVKSVEAGDDMTSIYQLIAPSDEIDEATAAATVPDWTGRFGTTLDTDPSEPAAPTITRIRHGEAGTDDVDGLIVLVEAGRNGSVRTWTIEIDTKLVADSDWTTLTIDAADGGSPIAGYSAGDAVQVRARGLSDDDVPGPYCATINVTI